MSFQALVYQGCYSLKQIDLFKMIFQHAQEGEDQHDVASKRGESRQRSIGRVSGGRGRHPQKTSKSRKRKGSKGSRQRFGSVYKDSDSSDAHDDASDNFSQF
jgi:hypothetical protein